jgi:hypothetical protein
MRRIRIIYLKIVDYRMVLHRNMSTHGSLMNSLINKVDTRKDLNLRRSMKSIIDFRIGFPSTLLYCITLGGRSTGKSYSLFGDNSSENQGLVPRVLHSLFAADSETVLIQVNRYLSYSDHFIDLLKPPREGEQELHSNRSSTGVD